MDYIFITGICGFIGSHLAQTLEKIGIKVYGIDNLSTGKKENLPAFISWDEKDIRDKRSFCSPSKDHRLLGVVHLAAQTSGEKSFELPEYDAQTNFLGSLNAYTFAREQKAKWFINFSSMSVYGDKPSDQIIFETDEPKPVSLYGNTKHAAERMLYLLWEKEKYQKDSLPVTSFRLFNAYGPGQNLDEMKQGMISIYLSYFLKHPFIEVKGSKDRVRDFIYIDDILSAILLVIKNPPLSSKVYNLSTGIATKVETVISYLKEATSSNKEIIYEGHTLGDISGFAGSSQAFKDDYGWASQTNMKEGIFKMVSHYKGIYL